MKKKFFAGIALAAAFAFAGCGASFNGADGEWGGSMAPGDSWMESEFGTTSDSKPDSPESGGNYQYDSIVETNFHTAAEENSIYFSLDRNTANYSQVRSQLNMGNSVAADSVRIEELINYFSYDYPAPQEGEVMAATAYLTDCPWEPSHKLVTVGVKTEEKVLTAERNNYVFLIDVSGSMGARVRGLEGISCLDLVKTGVEKLVRGLGDNDAVAIATYAGQAGQLLEPTMATEAGKQTILRAVEGLTAYGSTNGSGGLEVAYDLAERHFSENGNNRVILLSDGDFNVGLQSSDKLLEFIQEKAKTGVYLSVLGVGMGNMRDDFMQTLALNGNGNYAYIDTPTEAEKVMGEELNGMLVAVAKDAKAGVTFSEETVEKYRLIGYDMKIMSEDDFNNEQKDAGEIGSNLCVTALFEVELKEDVAEEALLGNVEIRFKNTDAEETAGSATAEIRNILSQNEDALFISCVAEFGLLLRNSAHKGNASYDAVLSRLADLPAYLARDVYKTEFKTLVEKAKGIVELKIKN